MSPYFQRNLVWRQIHKVDFIKTIMLGYPFPQIFIARGTIDLATMSTTSCIVDGQQRMNSIVGYVKDEFAVDGNFFSELTPKAKEEFFKYQIPIIDLDIDNEDPEIVEIFQRLNRTFYSLSTIEKLATEFAASEFMLVAKLLSFEIKFKYTVEEEEENLPLQNDPTIPDSFIEWAGRRKVKHFGKFVLEWDIFTNYELTRQVHLMFTLNALATFVGDFYNRNEFVNRYLEEYSEKFDRKDEAFDALEKSAAKIMKLKLKKGSYWLNKANAFSLICLFARNVDLLDGMDDKAFKVYIPLMMTQGSGMLTHLRSRQ